MSHRDSVSRAPPGPVDGELRILVDAGLLNREKRGTWAHYSLVPCALERTAVVLTGL
ncbi:hypothetical protein RCH07_003384 [Arthrobacter sp. CG_A4]|nr:hypothetical protein [Arthrobacter sp. CG_A4]